MKYEVSIMEVSNDRLSLQEVALLTCSFYSLASIMVWLVKTIY
ncbi:MULTISPECIES: hypothetical protein [unclassified Endozoicomonas]